MADCFLYYPVTNYVNQFKKALRHNDFLHFAQGYTIYIMEVICMNQGTGLSVCGGIAIGPAVVRRGRHSDTPLSAGTPQQEQAKFNAARETARQQLTALYENACRTVGEHEAAFLTSQSLIFVHGNYLSSVFLLP